LAFAVVLSAGGTLENIKQSLYDVIGVPAYATQDEIMLACFSLGELYRPDKNPGSEYCAAKFSAIESAYLVLCNPVTREAHDRHLAHTEAHPKTGTRQNQMHQPRVTRRIAGVVKHLFQSV